MSHDMESILFSIANIIPNTYPAYIDRFTDQLMLISIAKKDGSAASDSVHTERRESWIFLVCGFAPGHTW
jgi:hypothetical protein